MRQVTQDYKNIRQQTDSYYEVRVALLGNTYQMGDLRMVHIDSALFDGSGPQIGGTFSTQCEIEVEEESASWPRMARFDVEIRLSSADGNQKTSWIPFGRFYTDIRNGNEQTGVLHIKAFDGMLKLEQSWTDKIPSELLPASWPITSRAFCTMIQSAGLASFEDLTQLDNTVAIVGLNTASTIRDVLRSIAAANGGNWAMITRPENGVTVEKLRLVKFRNPVEITTEATTEDYVYIGRSLINFERSPILESISAVRLESEGGTVDYAGDDTGYQLNGGCEFATSEGVAQLCLDQTQGFVYKPFTASNAFLDPITELGDIVAIDGDGYQAMHLSWNLGKMPIADLGADYDQEIDHEYTITSAQAKQYRKVMAATDEKLGDLQDEFSTAIQQTEQQISLVAQSAVTQTEFEAVVESLQDQIDGNIQSWSGNVVPTLNNSPASDWTTPTLKAEHVGDMYFINSDAGIPEAGNYYRFEENNGVYSWQLLTDSALSEALAQAQAAMAAAEDAQETADEAGTTARLKGRIFVNQPTPPYSVGDLWFDSAQSEIMTCMTARASGSFRAADWVKRNKYTDDSAFQAFQTQYNETITAVQGQLDQKAETYYQAIAGIAVAGVTVIGISGGSGHGGDLWYRTSDNTTWFYDENQNTWVQQDVPDEVFDKIDGKAQIFIAQPYPPYNVGDLWFNSAQSEIMTCVTARPSGSFVSSDWEKRNKYTDDTALTNFVGTIYTPEIAAVQASLDGKVDTYFYAEAPTLNNKPASDWTTTALKNAHVDDLYYDTTTGYVYRFVKSGSTYKWERVKDSDITSAMQAASTAQDTADGKRRVFVAQPTTAQAYDVGDLWVNAKYPSSTGATYNNDLLRCKTAKAAGASGKKLQSTRMIRRQTRLVNSSLPSNLSLLCSRPKSKPKLKRE